MLQRLFRAEAPSRAATFRGDDKWLRARDSAPAFAQIQEYFLTRAAPRLRPSECCGCPLLISATI
jgi:hypothetical protein